VARRCAFIIVFFDDLRAFKLLNNHSLESKYLSIFGASDIVRFA